MIGETVDWPGGSSLLSDDKAIVKVPLIVALEVTELTDDAAGGVVLVSDVVAGGAPPTTIDEEAVSPLTTVFVTLLLLCNVSVESSGNV